MRTAACSAGLSLAGVLLSVCRGGELCCEAPSPAATCRTKSALYDRATLEGELPLAGKIKAQSTAKLLAPLH